MKKITQKKSNLKLLVESIADEMTDDRVSQGHIVLLGANDIPCTDQYISMLHGECPIYIRDVNGRYVKCDKFIIGDDDSETCFVSINRKDNTLGMYDIAEFAYKYKQQAIEEYKKIGMTLPSGWRTHHSYYFKNQIHVKPGEYLKAWLLNKKVYDNSNGGSVNEASDGTCVVVRYRAPAEKGVKDYSVRMTIEELHQFVEANGNPVDIQEFMTRLSEKGSADFDAKEPITFWVERA